MYSVKSPCMEDMLIVFPKGKCVVWSDVYDGRNYTQAILRCLDPSFLAYPAELSLEGYTTRYPKSSRERGLYCYMSVANDVDSVLRFIDTLDEQLNLFSLAEGPAVLDVPILPYSILQKVIDYHEYVSQTGLLEMTPMNSLCMSGMYSLAIQQFNLFPDEVKQKLPWYGPLLHQEFMSFSHSCAINYPKFKQ